MAKPFRDGQKVRVARVVSDRSKHPTFTESMKKWLGRVVTIRGDIKHCCCLECCPDGCYKIVEDGDRYLWSSRWLKEDEDENESIEVIGASATLYRLKKSGLWQSNKVKDRTVLVADLVGKLVQREFDNGSSETPVLPVGTRYYSRQGVQEVLVFEEPPQMRTILFEDRKFNLALPYVVYCFYFANGLMPEYKTRMFFRNSPLESLDDKLFMSNLTHVKVGGAINDPFLLGAVCMKAIFGQHDSLDTKVSASLRYYWQTVFSAEIKNDFHIGASEIRKQDQRVGDLATWQEESRKNPLFVLEVPWIDYNLTVGQVVREAFKNQARSDSAKPIDSAEQLANLMYQLKEVDNV